MCNRRSEHLQDSTPGAFRFSAVRWRQDVEAWADQKIGNLPWQGKVQFQLNGRQLVLDHPKQTKARHRTALKSVLYADYTVREKSFFATWIRFKIMCDCVVKSVCCWDTACSRVTAVIRRIDSASTSKGVFVSSHLSWQLICSKYVRQLCPRHLSCLTCAPCIRFSNPESLFNLEAARGSTRAV